jgi:hypothetical protein
MKKGLVAVAILLVAGIALLLDLDSKQSPTAASPQQSPASGEPGSQPPSPSGLGNNPSSSPSVSTSAAAASSPTTAPPLPVSLAERAGAVAPETTTPPPDIPPEIVVQNVRRAIRQFGSIFGGNPVGTNPEITSQLSGKNPKGINFIKPETGMRVNGNGELVDPWGTPLFFHQLSATDTEVRSAGPDKRMWTSDDVVAR